MYTDSDSNQLCFLVGETLGKAIVDTGCPFTVAGETWLKTYINTLSRKDRLAIRYRKSKNKFRFGSGALFPSEYNILIPIYVGSSNYTLSVDIVKCNIPLLLSRETLKRAQAKIDIGRSLISFLGVTIPLTISSSGHMCLAISRSLDPSNKETQGVLKRVLFTSPIEGIGSDLKNKATKLHLQFCHPTADRLIDLIKKAGTSDKKVFDAIKSVTDHCDVCIRNRKPHLRPVVGMPLATQFNETVAMDLKSRGPDGYILHLIDHLTRYSAACLIRDKKKGTIIKGIMDNWIKIFGPPKSFLTDNGGEFVNHEFIDLAEKFNIVLKTTAAESAWSNGLCERHNAILNSNVNKVLADGDCSLEVAISWAVAAKNSLASVYGFSPNILVFGKNPNFPSVFTNTPPANNPTCLNDYVAENLNAMHLARKAFVEQESAERLRRALYRKSRTYSNVIYHQGDKVYYWRNDRSESHGPAVVIGRDGQQILLKHGGVYIRVHPCRMQHCTPQSPISVDHRECENYTPGQPASINSRQDNNLDVDTNHTDHFSDEEDSYVTAHENSDASDDDEEQSETLHDDFVQSARNHETTDVQSNPEPNNTNENVQGTSTTVHTSPSVEWTRVMDTGDLPKVNSTVECKFPNYQFNVKCTILSRAGKASAGNWHFLNIEEDDGEGKCCSFKNTLWRHVTNDDEDNQQHNVDDNPASQEIYYGSCDSAFESAKQEEIEKWKRFKTFTEVPDKGEKTISTRWVCTRKIKGGKVVHKARLVARGFEEDSKTLRTDSPTCAKESLRLCLSIISCQQWKLHTLDVKSAFLQGTPMQRTVLIKPPKEANSMHLWKMLRCPYGLADAGRLWYLRLKKELLDAGLTLCKYDQALFMWFLDGKLAGILACHVDDVIYGGIKQFHDQVISKIKMTFSIGMEEDTNLKYLGLRIIQTEDGINVSTHDYAKSLEALPCPNNTVHDDREFSSEEVKNLKQFCGQINWLTTQGRPDLAFESCFVSNSLKTGNRQVFHRANKIIRRAQTQNVSLHFPCSLDIYSVSVVSFCDASFANLPNAGSQGGFISFIVDKNGLYSPVTWQSRKIRRVVKSTIAAECLAAVEAAENTIYIATLLGAIIKSPRVDTFLFCDNRNLVNAVHSSTNLDDKRLVIDVSVLRDLVDQGELTKFLWVSTDCQLADVLTKQGASAKLLCEILNNLELRFDKTLGHFT